MARCIDGHVHERCGGEGSHKFSVAAYRIKFTTHGLQKNSGVGNKLLVFNYQIFGLQGGVGPILKFYPCPSPLVPIYGEMKYLWPNSLAHSTLTSKLCKPVFKMHNCNP